MTTKTKRIIQKHSINNEGDCVACGMLAVGRVEECPAETKVKYTPGTLESYKSDHEKLSKLLAKTMNEKRTLVEQLKEIKNHIDGKLIDIGAAPYLLKGIVDALKLAGEEV